MARPEDARRLDGLAAGIDGCRDCPLWEHATQGVPGEGPPTASIVMVGEQPGDHEDRQGQPFVGPAGRILDDAMEEAGLDRSLVFVTNAVKHFKWKARGKRRIHDKPSRGEVLACRQWLEREVAIVEPDILVALGATAGQALAGPSYRVGASRGQTIDTDLGTMIGTIHPSAVLRDRNRRQELFAGLVDDLRAVSRAAEPGR